MIAMKRLSDEEIDYYASHGEWRGKAGGYALQGYGEVYVRHIAGSYSNVVGLPLAETRVLLKSAGYRHCLNGWIERGIGETRAALVDDGEIVEARIELDGVDTGGKRARRAAGEQRNQWPQRGRGGAKAERISAAARRAGGDQGQTLTIEVTRSAIPARSRGSVRSRGSATSRCRPPS